MAEINNRLPYINSIVPVSAKDVASGAPESVGRFANREVRTNPEATPPSTGGLPRLFEQQRGEGQQTSSRQSPPWNSVTLAKVSGHGEDGGLPPDDPANRENDGVERHHDTELADKPRPLKRQGSQLNLFAPGPDSGEH